VCGLVFVRWLAAHKGPCGDKLPKPVSVLACRVVQASGLLLLAVPVGVRCAEAGQMCGAPSAI
jgi:hypothetical protein